MLAFAWKHRRGLGLLGLAAAAGLGSLGCALGMDEGRRLHIRKQLSEAAAMPGRLFT